MEEQPRDHGVEAAAFEGDLVGLDAASASSLARAMAGGEDGREVCGPEGAGLAAAAPGGGLPEAGEDPGGAFPGRARFAGEAGPGSRPRQRPSPRWPGPGQRRGAQRRGHGALGPEPGRRVLGQ